MSPDTIEAVRCALQTVCETGGTMDELALIEQADRIAELEQQLSDVGSINLRLMEKLAESKKENAFMKYYLTRLANGVPMPDSPSSVLSALKEQDK